MSWWSDKDNFDEFDSPYCVDCSGSNSYEQCKRCQEEHDDYSFCPAYGQAIKQ